MPSIGSSVANTRQGGKFFVVITQAVGADILTEAGAAIPSGAGTAGAKVLVRLAPGAVVRDLGKTVRFPANPSTSTTQETLRLVQLVDTLAMTALVGGLPASFVNYNEGVGGLPTFYLRILPNSAGTPRLPIVASLGI